MRLSTLLTTALLCGRLVAQVPQAFDFQGVARDASGNVLSAQPVSVRLSVHSGTAGGPIAYQETHAVSTNAFGLFSVAVGQGSTTQGVFADVAWGAAAHFLHVELDASGGSNYLDIGTTQLLSVPYALHAGGVDCPTVSLLGDTLKQANGCYVIIPGVSAANGGCLDADNDGFYNNTGCPPLDCDDANASVNPGATELCGNGTDDDCDGAVDNNTDPLAFVTYYADGDGDGFGDAAISNTACAQPAGYVGNNDDCDDSDPAIFPGSGCGTGECSGADTDWIDQNQGFYLDLVQQAFSNCLVDNGLNVAAALACTESILDDAFLTGTIPVSAACHGCAYTYLECFAQNCIAACISGPNSASCQQCITTNCIPAFNSCVGLVDLDGDGWASGSDCDETNAAIHPGATEVCDTIDNDCDGQVDEGNVCNPCPDDDGDGFTTCDGDCDDTLIDVFPGASEVCGDGVDNDCDGTVDNTTTWFEDLDGDGFGNPGSPVDACEQPAGFVSNGDDCDDQDPNVFPLAGPGTGCSSCSSQDSQWMDDNYLALWNTTGIAVGECAGLTGQAAWDCLRTHIEPFVPIGPTCLQCAVERAFTVLGTCSTQCVPWLLSDGVVAGSADCNLCSIGNGVHAAFATCSGVVDQDGDGVPASVDCNDNDAAFRPGVVDICDGQDNNCDGQTDEDCGACTDNDADGFTTCAGDCDDTNANVNPGATELCGDGLDNDCDGQADEGCGGCLDNDADGFTTCDGDCNDTNTAVNPGATEICGDGLDNNCDGQADENCGPQELCNGLDDDGDGLVDEGFDLGQPCGCGGVWVCDGNGASVCSVPPVPEVCGDGLDNDCDGQVDENCGGCTDNDADGFTTCAGDCDDTNANVNPGENELCGDGIDNNCDGQADEGCGGCLDNDADGFTTCQGDCNDTNTAVNPGQPELCGDGIDNNCDGQADEGCAPEVCDGIDNDGDGLTDAADPGLVLVPCENQTGVCNGAQKTANLCVGGTWLTCAGSDYAIGSPVYEVTETSCDTQDNDCDGLVDEDGVCD